MLFYCNCLRANKYKYNYGRQANRTLKDLLVPSIDDIPEWVNETKLPQQPNTQPYNENIISLQDKDWSYFKLQDIFEMKRGC
jgi:hypothetical protein